MPDDLESQLQAFGATLESHTGEPIASGSPVAAVTSAPPSRRRWAIAGAAASVIAVVVGLVALSGRHADAPAAQPAGPTSTSVAGAAIDPELLRSAPIEELATGCDPADVVVSSEFVATGTSEDEAFDVAYEAIAQHTPPELEVLPADGWQDLSGEPITVRYLDRGRGVEAVVRMQSEAEGWRVTELAQCVPGRVPAVVQTTTIPPTNSLPTVDEPVGDDPLGLERDGWTLVQRDTEPFAAGELPCGVAAVVEEIDGADQVHDILTPPDGDGLDLDIQIIDVGSIERGQALAEFVAAIGDCIADTQGVDVETGAMSSIRATWFRAGPDFALVAIVGEGTRSIVLEIEGAPFDDDLIGALAQRADQFLRGEPVAEVEVIKVVGGSDLGTPQVAPVAGQVKLWVSNQSFEDDPVAVMIEIDGVQVVDDSFEVGGQHNWFSFLVDGLEPGEHTLTATSDTGAAFEGTFTLPPDEPRWMVVDYWYYPDDAEGRHFTLNESEEPIAFA